MMSIPKENKAIEADYEDCIKHNVFVKVSNESYQEYVVRSQKDVASAKNDFDTGYFYWCIIKAYQSLFFIANALLVKNLGYYSKDHRCIITALLKEKIISEKIADKISATFETKIAAEMDSIRLKRNSAMYQPDSWQSISKESAEKTLNDVRSLVSQMAGLL